MDKRGQGRGAFLNECNLKKLRKKLRQIENLQQLNRQLSAEEKKKVASQEEIRKEIQSIISNKAGQENFKEVCVNSPNDDQLLIDLSCGAHELQDSHLFPKVVNKSHVIFNNATNNNQIKTSSGLENEDTFNSDTSTVDWTNEIFCISTLIGHNDIIYCVDADESLVVTCSRDTTVKVWDACTGNELSSLRGHTAAVTSVLLIPYEAGINMTVNLRMKENQRIAISGGHDCMIYIWSILEGLDLHSMYTYNSITCLGYFQKQGCLISGTDGGKLELWNLPSLENLDSFATYEDSISQIKVQEEEYACISTSEGIVNVIELRDKELHCIFSSEGVLSRYNNVLIPRPIRSLETFQNNIYYGDDGANVKIMDWKLGTAKKLLNNLNQSGLTGAIRRTDQEIIFSNYDIDVGQNYLNIYTLPEHKYAASLTDGDKERIFSISCLRTKAGNLRIITAGTKLKMWTVVKMDQNGEMQEGNFVRPLYTSTYTTIEINSDDDWPESNDSNSDEGKAGRYEQTFHAEDMEYKTSIWSWCNLL